MCRNPTCSLSNKGMEGKCYSIIDNIGNACISICFIKGENLHYKQKEFPNKAASSNSGFDLNFYLLVQIYLFLPYPSKIKISLICIMETSP